MTSKPVIQFGATGLVGGNILSTLLTLPSSNLQPVTTITRRSPKDTSSPQLNAVVNTDTASWPGLVSAQKDPVPYALISSLGSTRAAAGGVANQWKIDHDLNIEIARAAKAAGVSTYLFISSAGTRGLGSSLAPYSRMKVGVEDTVRELDFEHTVIMRPGAILGERENHRMAEGLFKRGILGLDYIRKGWTDAFGQPAEVIARAAVRAIQLVEEGKAPSKYWVLEGADILRLGRDEWPTTSK